jgi:hypothetical protein
MIIHSSLGKMLYEIIVISAKYIRVCLREDNKSIDKYNFKML